MADLVLALSPAVIFASRPKTDIPNLVVKPNDQFIVIQKKDYVELLKQGISKSGLNPHFRKYLSTMVDRVKDKTTDAHLTSIYNIGKDDINFKDMKYFGEVIGPVHLFMLHHEYDHVAFPTRSNYELFDYFMGLDSKHGKKYVGYSAKMVGSSNTLTPTIIEQRIILLAKKNLVLQENKLAASIIQTLATMPINSGLAIATSLLVKNNALPSTVPRAAVMALHRMNLTQDAATLQSNKLGKLNQASLSNKDAYKVFMDSYALLRTKLADTIKKKYLNTDVGGKPKPSDLQYDMTNISYALGMLVADASIENKFDVTPLIHITFQDLNVVKTGINRDGIPSFDIHNVTKTKTVYKLRTKYRWDLLKDKLGVQL
jgi:hypothetical protein